MVVNQKMLPTPHAGELSAMPTDDQQDVGSASERQEVKQVVGGYNAKHCGEVADCVAVGGVAESKTKSIQDKQRLLDKSK